MRKLSLTTLSLVALMFASCGGSNFQESNGNDSIAKVQADSIAKVEAEKRAKEQAKADSVAKIENLKNSASPDLKLFDLYGKVKSVAIKSGRKILQCETDAYDCIVDRSDRYNFTPEGKWKFHSEIGERISRNANQQVASVDGETIIGMGPYYCYTYNEEGYPTKITVESQGGSGGWTGETHYTYTQKGMPSKSTYSGNDREKPDMVITEEYTYTDFDSIGNWTSRQVKRSYSYTRTDYTSGRSLGKVNKTETFTDTRTITYYE